MDEKQAEALGRRLVAFNGFRWLRGMTDGMDGALIESDEYGMRGGDTWCINVGGCVVDPGTLGWPDMREPATIGCVLSLVREWWGDSCSTAPAGHQWYVDDGYDGSIGGPEDTEAEALVAALEAARG